MGFGSAPYADTFDDQDRPPREIDMPGFLKYILLLNMLSMLSGSYY
ncbi:hypothetical protein [Nocardia testacea]